MKQLFILFLFIGVSQLSFSQSACDKWKQIQGKSESDFTDVKRLKIYWSKRCACESGQITGGTWDYTVELVNSNYDMYHERRDKFPSEYSYSGPLVPDRKISANECNSDNNLGINDAGITNCDQKAFDASKDPQNFANDFMSARCQCIEGVPFESDAKKLAATMQINHKNVKTYYGESFTIPDPMQWTECPILEFGQEANTQNSSPTLVYTGRESDLDKLKDQYLETFSTRESFNAYVSGENIKRIGVTMAQDFADNLKALGTLIQSTDPLAMHQDYMQKINSIESLEAKFNAESNTYFFESGQQLGGSIMSKDYETAMFQAGGILNSHLERKEAEAELEKQKKAMKSELQKKLYKIYKKTKDFNEINRKKYLKFAAFTDDESTEAYYLGLVDNLDCFDKKLWSGVYHVDGSKMVNNCPVPKLEDSKTIENKFITEDARLSKIAEKKYEIFLEKGYTEFRDAAITFASAAGNTKALSKYFDQAGKYCREHSSVLQLNNYLTALSIDPNFYSKNGIKSIDSLKTVVQKDVISALKENNLEFIQIFIKSGLDKTIQLDEKSLLLYTISIDQPEALQSILNHYVEGKSETAIQKYLQQTIMLCAANNAGNCIEKFVELGVDVDFILSKEHPIEVAEKNLAPNAYSVLLKNSHMKMQFIEKYKDSPINIMVTAITEPAAASKQIENIVASDNFSRVIDGLITNLPKTESYFQVLSNSQTILSYIYKEQMLTNKIKKQVRQQLFVPFYESNVHLYFENKLIASSTVPTLKNIGYLDGYQIIKYNYTDSYGYDLHTYYDGSSADERVYKSEFDTYDFLSSDNLAWIAYTTHNPLLFKAIDESYDLTQVKGSNGKSLFECMLTNGSFWNIQDFAFNEDNSLDIGWIIRLYGKFSAEELVNRRFQSYSNPVYMVNNFSRKNYDDEVQFFPFEIEKIKQLIADDLKLGYHVVWNRDAFFSKDFDFMKPIKGRNPIFLYLESAINCSIENGRSNRFIMAELSEIFSKYEVNPTSMNNTGNTLLHWIAETLSRRVKKGEVSLTLWGSIVWKIGYWEEFMSAVNKLNIDRSVKNNNGLTAYKLWKGQNCSYNCDEGYYKILLK